MPKKILHFQVDQASFRVMRDNLQLLQGMVMNAALDGVDEMGQLVLMRAKAMTPIKTSALYSSAYIEVEQTASEVTAIIGYGGPKYVKLNPLTLRWSDAYAVTVHEFQGRSEQSRKFGASWKFLEKAVNSIKPDYLPHLARVIGMVLEGTGTLTIQKVISSKLKNP